MLPCLLNLFRLSRPAHHHHSACNAFFAFALLLVSVLAMPALAYISVPERDGDGTFLVTWTGEADMSCTNSSTAYQLIQGSTTYNFGLNDDKFKVIQDKSPGEYTYKLKVHRCAGTVPGQGSYMASGGSDTVRVGVPWENSSLGFRVPHIANTRGFPMSWNPLCCLHDNYASGDVREGYHYKLVETGYPLSGGVPYFSREINLPDRFQADYYKNFPDERYYYSYLLCKGTGSDPCTGYGSKQASGSVRIKDADIPYVTQPANAVGSTPYTTDVDYKGNAAIEIPIKNLPGDNGLEPAISLTYNSGSASQRWFRGRPEGLFEHGWGVSGLSEIQRCRQGENDEIVDDPDNGTHADPSARRRIQFNNTDSLCIDSQKLILVSGAHFKVGAVYRTELESYKRITIKALPGHEGNANTGEIWFEIRQPDGRISHYGKNTSARLRYYSNYPYLAWAVDRVEDAFGNAMTYSYHKKTTVGGSPLRTNTILNYQSRSVENSLRFTPTNIVHPGGRLSFSLAGSSPKIEVKDASGLSLRTYYLGYTSGSQNLLSEIQECAGGSCLPPLNFDYYPATHNNSDPRSNHLSKLTDGVGAITQFEYVVPVNNCSHVNDFHEVFGDYPTFRTEHDLVKAYATSGQNFYYQDPSLQGDLKCRGGISIGVPVSLIKTLGTSVKRMKKSDGIGGYQSWAYSYGDAGFKSTRGRGFIGFSRVKRVDEQTDVTTYTQYRLRHKVAGMVQSEYVYANSSNFSQPLSTQDNYHNILTLNHGSGRYTYLPYTMKEESRSYEGGHQVVASVTSSAYSMSGVYPTQITTTTTNGRALSTGGKISHPWGDYYSSSISASNAVSANQSVTKFSNYTSASDWRIQFVREENTTQYNGAIGGSGVDTKSQNVKYTPWQQTRSIATETRFDNDPELELTTSKTYDERGNVLSVAVSGQNVERRTSRFSDYWQGPAPAYSYNALGHLSINGRYDHRYRRPTFSADPNGRENTAQFDAFERPIQSADHDGNITTVEYRDCDDVTCCSDISCSDGAYVKITSSAIAPDTKEVHDSLNRVIRTYTQGLNSSEWIKSAVVYNHRGLVEKQTLPYKNSSQRKFITFQYDNLGRKTRATRPDGSYTQWQYGTEVISGKRLQRVITADRVLNPSGSFHKTRAKVAWTDAAGRLVRSQDGYTSTSGFSSLGAMSSSSVVTTTYEYDALGKPSKVTVSGGSDGTTVTTSKHDRAGNRIELNGPNVGRVQSKYTALGQMRWNRDAAGNETTYHYDLLGRLEWKLAGDDYYRFDFDEDAIGLLNRATHNDSYTAVYDYDGVGRLLKLTESVKVDGDSASGISRYTYDSQGRVHTQTLASGFTTRNSYSSTGYLKEVFNNSTNASLHRVESIGVAGIEEMRLGNGTRTKTTYDLETGFISEISHKNASGNLFNRQNYLWYSNGNMQQRGYNRRNQGANTYKETFTYDGQERLDNSKTYINNGYRRTTDYAYNRLGNITSKTSTRTSDDQVTNYQYGVRNSGCSSTPGPHAVSRARINGTYNYLCYDANGYITRYNATSGHDKFLAYNTSGQPTTITVGNSLNDSTPEAKDEFQYGPAGQRYFKRSTYKDGSTTKREYTYYFSDGTEATYYDNDPTTREVRKTHASSNVQFIKRVDYLGAKTYKTQYLHKDHLGSVVAITQDGIGNGDAKHTLAFEPFGERRAADWSRQLSDSETESFLDQVATNSTRGFTGHEHLDRTGFIHMNGRVYDPTLGRFLTPDPIVQAPTLSQNWNRYTYGWNNPLRFTDPSGYSNSSTGGNNSAFEMKADQGAETVHEDEVENEDGTIFVVISNGEISIVNSKGEDVSSSSDAGKALSKALDRVEGSKSKRQKLRNQVRAGTRGGGSAPTGSDSGSGKSSGAQKESYWDAFGDKWNERVDQITGAADRAVDYWIEQDNPLMGTLAATLTSDNIGNTTFNLTAGAALAPLGGSAALNSGVANLLVKNPGLLRFLPQGAVRGTLNAAGWVSGTMRGTTAARGGWSMVLNPGPVARFQWSAAGGRHSVSYWKVSGSSIGTLRIPYFRFGSVPASK